MINFLHTSQLLSDRNLNTTTTTNMCATRSKGSVVVVEEAKFCLNLVMTRVFSRSYVTYLYMYICDHVFLCKFSYFLLYPVDLFYLFIFHIFRIINY